MTATASKRPVVTTNVDVQHVTPTPDNGECPTARDEFTAWLTASCQRQALPVTVTDPTTLAAVATLLRQGAPKSL
jgi:hypothetical protein